MQNPLVLSLVLEYVYVTPGITQHCTYVQLRVNPKVNPFILVSNSERGSMGASLG
jgi:hypothetical protein